MNYLKITFILFMSIFLFSCSHNQNSIIKERIFQEYVDSNRISIYEEIQKKYENNFLILQLNAKEDVWWITNTTLFIIFSILPDISDILAIIFVLTIIYAIAWIKKITLTGGGILAILAFLGNSLGKYPWISPSITGIIYFGIIFVIFQHIFESVIPKNTFINYLVSLFF